MLEYVAEMKDWASASAFLWALAFQVYTFHVNGLGIVTLEVRRDGLPAWRRCRPSATALLPL